MMSSVFVDTKCTTASSCLESIKSQAPIGKSLCARSLAALDAASPSNISCSITNNQGNTSTDNRRIPAKFASGGRFHSSSSRSASTDEGSFSDVFEDSTSQESPIECLLADFTDSSGSDGEGLSEVDSTTVASKMQLPRASASVAVYSVSFLLQLRASICGTSKDGAATSSLGYGTKRASECPVGLDAHTSRSEVASIQRSGGAKLSWSSQQRRIAHSQDDNEQVSRAARSILNKLTIEKFDALYEQIATCGVKTSEHVKLLMHEIFEKATVQHHFLDMYADLCVKLEADPRMAPGRRNGFRHLLLAQCQSAFEQQFDTSAHVGVGMDDEEILVRKQRSLGNIKFVGKLLVRGMLSGRLLCSCAEELLGCNSACNESLESLAALLTVTGATFDNPNWPYFQRLEAVFTRISEIVRDKSVPARVRFLLRDLLDLRKAQWSTDVSPPSKQGAGPMRLEEIRASAPQSPSCASNSSSNRSPTVQKQSKNLVNVAGKTAQRQSNARFVKETPAESPLPPQRRTVGAHRRAAHANKASAATGTSSFDKPAVNLAPASPCPSPEIGVSIHAEVSQKTPSSGDSAGIAVRPVSSSDAGSVEVMSTKPFCMKAFRRELSATMKELVSHRNVAIAVRQIRAQNVPVENQAKEFADLITRAAEESRGPARRTAFAFCGGLAAAEQSAFSREECLVGVSIFFKEIYEDLCEDVSKLPAIVTAELLPTLQTVLPAAELNALLPTELQIRIPSCRQLA